MLGKDLFKVESNVNLTNDNFKSLVLFYEPLIGPEAMYLYEFLLVKGSSFSFEELSKILNSTSYTIDKFELLIDKLNEYRLVNTLKDENDNRYIFILNNPLSFNEFISDDIFVRNFITKTSGEYYHSLLSNVRIFSKHQGFVDVSKKIDPRILETWTKEDETFVKIKEFNDDFNFNTFFNVNDFLKDISLNLLPLKYRSEENMKELATLADLYNISYDKMRTFIPKVCSSDSNEFDLNLLRYLCMSANPEFSKVDDGIYNVPCELFLMNKQNGQEVTKYDKKILYSLSSDYHLNPVVINVLIEHALKKCDNHLYENYLYAVASDLRRNNIVNEVDALKRLDNYEPKKNTNSNLKPVYTTDNNPEFDQDRFMEIMARRGGKA